MKSFIIKSIYLTIIIFILGTLVYITLFKQFYLAILPAIPVFFCIVTNIVHTYLVKMAGKSGIKFTSQYMATSFIKMFFYLAVAVVYVIINKTFAKIFLVNYLLIYVVYTTFEVIEISKVVRQMNK